MEKISGKNLQQGAVSPTRRWGPNPWMGRLVRHIDDGEQGLIVGYYPPHMFGSDRYLVLMGGRLYRICKPYLELLE